MLFFLNKDLHGFLLDMLFFFVISFYVTTSTFYDDIFV